MNRAPWIISAYAALLLQAVLEPVWNLGGTSPQPLLILMVFLAQCGPANPALLSALIFGILTDVLSRPYPQAGVILGPYAVGYVVGAYAVLQLRNLLFRNSVLALVVMTFAAGLFVELVAVALLALRGLGFLAADAPPDFTALASLGRGMLGVIYTTLLAIPLGWILLQTRRTWHFTHD